MGRLLTRKDVAARIGKKPSTVDRRWKLTKGYEGSYDPNFPQPILKPNDTVDGWLERDIIAYVNGGKLPVFAPEGAAAHIDDNGKTMKVEWSMPIDEVGNYVAARLAKILMLDADDAEITDGLRAAAVNPKLIPLITVAVDALRKRKKAKSALKRPPFPTFDAKPDQDYMPAVTLFTGNRAMTMDGPGGMNIAQGPSMPFNGRSGKPARKLVKAT